MAISIDFESLSDTLEALTTQLKDYTGNTALLNELNNKLNTDIAFDFAGAKGNISGKGSIELFNSKDDKDTSDILGKAATNPKPLELTPAIIYNGDSCWTKYAVEATFKGSGEYDLESLGIGIDANAGIILSTYKKHLPSTIVKTAVSKDVLSIPLIFDVNDILSLKPEEAVAITANAKLVAQAEFKWSDILAQNMSRLSKWLDQGELLNLKIDASVTASVDVTIEGGFKLVFSRDANVPDKIRMAMKKSTGLGIVGKLGATITAQLSNPDDFKKAYTASLDAIFEKPLNVIEQINQATDINQLPESLQTDVLDLLDRFGVNDLDQLKGKIMKVETELTDAIKNAAKTKAELSFAYEYERLKTHQSLCELIIDDARLTDVHKNAISARLLDITSLANGEDIVLKRFFYQDSTSVKSSWGFNLGFGKWSAMSRNYSELEFIETRNSVGDFKLATHGMKGYKDNWFGDKRDIYISFDAEMNNFVNGDDIPTVNDFVLGLSVVQIYETNSFSLREAQETIDGAAILGMVAADDIDSQVEQLKATLDDATNIKVINILKISSGVFPLILGVMAKGDTTLIAKSLAAALPRIDHLPQGRANPEIRKNLYTNLLEGFITGSYSNPDALSNAARNQLRENNYKILAKREGSWRNAGGMKSHLLAGMIQNHPNMRNDIKNMSKGMKRLHDAYLNKLSFEELKPSYKLFDDLGEHSYYNRFFAHYLLSCAEAIDDVHEGIECIVKLEYKLNSTDKEIILSNR
jgi:hypothetical protein